MNTNLFSLFSLFAVSLQILFQVCGKYRWLIITIQKENSVISFLPVHRLPQLKKSSNCLNPISNYTTLPTGRHSSCCFQQNGFRITRTLKVSFTYMSGFHAVNRFRILCQCKLGSGILVELNSVSKLQNPRFHKQSLLGFQNPGQRRVYVSLRKLRDASTILLI